jgi:Flp pilus assembly pilin Flp
MTRKLLIALVIVAASSTAVLAIGGTFTGPGYWITGNDTGGIIPY